MNLYTWIEGGIQIHSFACGYEVVPASFTEETILMPLNSLDMMNVKNQLTIEVWIYFCTLNSAPLICLSVLLLVPHLL